MSLKLKILSCCNNSLLTNAITTGVVESSISSSKNHKISIQVLLNWAQIRNRRAVAFREYRQPHYRQKLLLAVCEPVFAKNRKPTSEKCGHLRLVPPKPHHPYDVLLAKDMSDEIEQSKLICLFHQNQMSKPDRTLMANEFQHEDMMLRFYNRDIAKICLENTKFEPLLHFAVGYPFTILFANDFKKIDKIFKICKKYPQAIMLSALIDHKRLITIEQLKEISKMGNLDHQRSQLCHTLTIGQQSLLSTLNYHSSQLTQLLNAHQNNQSTTSSDTKSIPSESD